MTEMMMLLLICLVLFGAKRIPEIGSSIGKGIREFKRGVSHLDDTVHADEPRTIVTSAMLDAETESGRAPKRLVD
jgi:sec-independent protein translocase protein TatA